MATATTTHGGGQRFWDLALDRARRAAAAAAVGDAPAPPSAAESGGERCIRALPSVTEYLHGAGVVLYLADCGEDETVVLDRLDTIAGVAVRAMDDERRRRFVEAGCPVTLGGFDPDVLRAHAAWWPVTLYDQRQQVVVAIGLY